MTEDSIQCPLITPYTTHKGIDGTTLNRLLAVRKWDIQRDEAGIIHNPIPFKWPDLLRKTIWDIDNDCDSGVPLELRQYQIQMIHHLIRMDKFINGDAVGLGKAQPLDAKILTPFGWKTMGDMEIGTEIVDPDGGYAVVEGVYPQGEVDIYRVTTNDGASTECCGNHLWTVQTPDDRTRGKDRIYTTLQLLDQGIIRTRSNGSVTHTFFTPIAVPTEWASTVELPIEPYTVGALLGDGGITDGVFITSTDHEIIQNIEQQLPTELYFRQCKDSITWQITKGNTCRLGVCNPYITALRGLGLLGCRSSEKFIPEIYLRSSIKARKELLKGLMDTDGECSKSGLCYYSTVSYSLALGVAELIRSLGGMAKINPRKPKWYMYKGDRLKGKAWYMVTVKTSFSPFKLKRKVSRWKPPQFARAIVSIELVGKKQAQCIRVLSKRHLYITDDYLVTHNTLAAIAAAAWLKQRKPEYKIVIVTTKSTTWQWADEFKRFSYMRPYVMRDKYQGCSSSEARYAQMKRFFSGDKKDVMIVKYDSIKGNRKKVKGKFDSEGNPIRGGKEAESSDVKFFTNIFKENKDHLILVFDECQKFKGTATAIRNLVFSISRQADKVWGLTATVMKNSLNEFYAVAVALGICPFGFMQEFMEEFCIMRPQYIGQGRKKMVLVGYRNIAKFKEGIRPFFLGRSQRQVKEPLPRLSTVYHPLDLSDRQIELLDDIKNGVFILPPALIKDRDGDLHEMERDPDNLMTQLSVQQLVANHPALLDPANIKEFYTSKLSPKEEALLDMLDGDLMGEKVLVFSKYKMWIDRLEKLTKEGNFTNRKFLRITGNENEKQRNENKRLFQNSPDHNLIVVNAAGIEGINLQQAAHLICLDLPWSWGDLIQLVGRMVRMASPHTACTLHILVAKGTIDEYAIETLKGKKGVFEKILGESHSAGILDDGAFLDLDSGMEVGNSDEEYRSLLKAHVKSVGMKKFLDGDKIEEARGNENYQMIFQKDSKKAGTNKKKNRDFQAVGTSKWGGFEEL